MSLLSLVLDDYPTISQDHHHIPSMLYSSPETQLVRHLAHILNQHPSKLEKDTSIVVDKDHFQAKIDVQQFKPDEITVKLNNDNTVTVEGKHEEKQDEHGFISRHFVRKYVLPEDCDVKKLQSSLSTDGVLSISAPKKPAVKQPDYKEIPIIRTGPIKKSVTPSSGQQEDKST
ncbi:hypothetical protein ABEB36_007458 [Hypothenemus hampei]|uniref:SHSP domain-containing protein n=1 Tax=Hypothenemus hampei TaxID=57062 RepID=A0ABD1EU15_HYPHA